ncbi:MAG: DUF4301 family protein [Bacteroidota bacterium]
MKADQAESIFTLQQLDQIKSSGKSQEEVLAQLKLFSEGFPAVKLLRHVSPEDGVLLIEEKDQQAYLNEFSMAQQEVVMSKFVPASGASSRMFKLLFAYLNEGDALHTTQLAIIDTFCQQILAFPFGESLQKELEDAELPLRELIEKKDFATIIAYVLKEQGLGFGSFPKALIPFHHYEDGMRTALEEHLVEAAHYCVAADRQVRLHFTVPPHQINKFDALLKEVVPKYEKAYDVHFQIEKSIQEPSTDTLAVDLENQPFIKEDGNLLFRPGGHGALLENLNRITADWVYIKNIDNVVHDDWKESTYLWKKLLGGVLYYFQVRIFGWLKQLEKAQFLLPEEEQNLLSFLRTELGLWIPEKLSEWNTEDRLEWFRHKLNRPIRVCGIIRTEEATGGGPFWIEEEGEASLQVIETAQINTENTEQAEILSRSRYAHITDLVCSIRDYQGEKFDLMKYRNDKMGFIVQKSLNGKPLKAMELPGLWNGAMADWNTIMLEVPNETFNPVKTVMDLLEPEHKAK